MTDEEIRDRLSRYEAAAWTGKVSRHMFADVAPDRENTAGARWNPLNVAAIYTSLTRETALAEAEHRLSLETVPIRSDISRTIYTLQVSLNAVIDLTDPNRLLNLGVNDEILTSIDKSSLFSCQRIGAAVDWYENDGMLVPSARDTGVNLVIYPSNQCPGYSFEVVEKEELNGPSRKA